jgi:sugar phosphate isomerase/epimerase
MTQLGLQLYTVKDEVERDLLGTLGKVAAIGYDGVEFSGYFGTPAGRLREVLQELKLEAAGTVVTLETMAGELEREIEYARTIGSPMIVCPFIPAALRPDAKGYRAVAESLNRYGRTCRDAGLRLLYHVHGFEFTPTDEGPTGMELLLAHMDPQFVNLEVDVYWVEHGRQDALAFLRDHAERSPYIHLKDMKDRETETDVEVGDGVLDIAGVVRDALRRKVDWLIVEQEKFDGPTLASAARSYENVRGLMGGASL